MKIVSLKLLSLASEPNYKLHNAVNGQFKTLNYPTRQLY